MKAKRRSTRSRTSSNAVNGSRPRSSRRTRRGSTTAYDVWREQARPAIRQAAREWQASPLFDVAEEIRVEVRGVMNDVTSPIRRRRTRTA
jgi:hypothetical protein